MIQEFNSLEEAKDYFQEKYNCEGFDNINKNNVIDNSIKVIETNNQVLISCLKQDSDVESPMEYGEGSTFKVFKSEYERDDFVKSIKKKLFYFVDKYEHGQVDYSISGTKNYPDSRWDVAHGCAVYVPEDYIQSEYKKMLKKENMTTELAKEHFVKDTNNILKNYTEWCNGETYYYTLETYDINGLSLNNDSCGGYIGYDYAENEQTNVLKSIAENYHIEEIIKNIDIIQKIPEYEHFNITTEQFLDACMNSDIKSAIKSHFSNIENNSKNVKLKM